MNPHAMWQTHKYNWIGSSILLKRSRGILERLGGNQNFTTFAHAAQVVDNETKLYDSSRITKNYASTIRLKLLSSYSCQHKDWEWISYGEHYHRCLRRMGNMSDCLANTQKAIIHDNVSETGFDYILRFVQTGTVASHILGDKTRMKMHMLQNGQVATPVVCLQINKCVCIHV